MLVTSRSLRSRGCHMCISRKVKCDETKPACLRCSRTKRQCPGYRDRNDLIFRPVQLQKTIEPSWEQLAIPCFLANFTVPEKHGRPGHLEFLPDLYGKRAPGGRSFDDALVAVSSAYLARCREDAGLTFKALKLYGTALASLRNALADDDISQEDTALTAVLLLSRFETVTGQELAWPSAHCCAEATLMKSRKPEKVNDRTLKIFRFMRMELALRNLCFLWTTPNAEATTAISPTLPPVTQNFASLILHAEAACLETRALLREDHVTMSSDPQPGPLVTSIRRILCLNRLLSDFEETMTDKYNPRTVAYPAPDPAYIFPDTQLAVQWLGFWSAQIRLRDILSACLAHETAPLGQPLRSAITQTLAERSEEAGVPSAADKICASVPFLLGEIDCDGTPRRPGEIVVGPAPMLVLSGLYVAGSAWSTGRERKRWICDRMALIGNQRGIGQALTFAAQLRDDSRISETV